MPGFPVPFIKFREDTANGLPLAGGKLYSFAAGTATPLATYTSSALNVPNANPTVLDASGRANIFIADGVGYKFQLNDALDNVVWAVDNVQVPKIATPPAPAEVPPGGIVAYGGLTAPSGWLLCDGSAVSSTTYPNLYAVILNRFGGSGSSFNLPNLQQRFPLGKAVSGTGATVGATGGLIDHTHSGPSHTHTVNAHNHDIAGHTHPVPYNGWGVVLNVSGVGGVLQVGQGAAPNISQATGPNVTGASAATTTGDKAVTTNADGTQPTGPSNPPFLVLNFIIKT
jgi:microcystin-dependent protein